MLRQRCWGVVMDEQYVQENILTGGRVAPVGGGFADSFMLAYSHFARRCRAIPDTSAARSALRACVIRAADGCRIKLVAPT